MNSAVSLHALLHDVQRLFIYLFLSSQEIQTEFVMLILLRLVEDVIAFQNVTQIQRRREILQAINAEMESLLNFMKELLKHYTDKMKVKVMMNVCLF